MRSSVFFACAAAWLVSALPLVAETAVRVDASVGIALNGQREISADLFSLTAFEGFPRATADLDYRGRLLDRAETKSFVPAIGPRVVGASYCPHDGHVNPLLLLRALRIASRKSGLNYLPGSPVVGIRPRGQGRHRVARSHPIKPRKRSI